MLRHLTAIAAGIGSVILAAALAVAINIGLLRAAGSPSGPGRLGPVGVVVAPERTSLLPPGSSGPGLPGAPIQDGVRELGANGDD